MPAKRIPWLIFAAFAAAALFFSRTESLFIGSGPLAAGKYLAWAAFLAFLAYSVYCSAKENLFRTITTMAKLHWGRQIGIDLYLGLSLTLFFIYLHQPSIVVVLLWLLPVLAFGNLATLLYLAIHYESIVAKFLN